MWYAIHTYLSLVVEICDETVGMIVLSLVEWVER